MEVAEKLCDDICLINRSRKVLDGTLRKVKESYGRHSVALRAEGGESVLEDRNLVARVERHSDEVEVYLAESADAQELLTRLIAAGARITRFELVEAALHDIFIERVGETDEQTAGSN